MIGSSPPSPSDHRYKGQRHGLRKFLEDFVRWAKANRPVLSPGSGLLATQTADGLVMRVVPAAGLPKRGMLPVGGIAAGATGTVTATLAAAHQWAVVHLALRPSSIASAALTVRDLPSAPGMAVFQAGDIVRVRQFSRSAAALR